MLAVGAESGQELAARGARSVAEALGKPPTEFPSNHAGFLGGEYGQPGDPELSPPPCTPRSTDPRPTATECVIGGAGYVHGDSFA